jgi:short-subunit dehydrogenase
MLGFVTGASSGLGEAFARRLAADGWDLAITARREDRLRALAAELSGQHGVTVDVHTADLANPGHLDRLAAVVAAIVPDLLVNNAGFAGYREFAEVHPQVVADLVAVHVTAVSQLTRAAVPGMVGRGSGAIINIASLLAFSGSVPPNPLPHRAMYVGVKAFEVAFSQALAGELAGTGVQVQVCCPGLVDTEFHAVAGRDLTGNPLPVLRAEDVVTAALEGLRLGEVVCAPSLADPALIEAVNQSQQALLGTAVRSPLAARYQAAS